MRQYTKADIHSLLDKFMEGTTTLEEEDTLTRFFLQGDTPAEWDDYRRLFAELEAMTPSTSSARIHLQEERQQPTRKGRRWWWAVAAVGIAVSMMTFTLRLSEQHTNGTTDHAVDCNKQLATNRQGIEADTLLRLEAPNQEAVPDTAAIRRDIDKRFPAQRPRRVRKQEPTMNDIDKTYALLAQAERERQQAEQKLEQAQQEIVHAQLTAAGFSAITLEDGSVIYVDEPKQYLAYEE